jgi:hypothetical protein
MAQCMRHAPLDVFTPSCLDMHGEYILTPPAGFRPYAKAVTNSDDQSSSDSSGSIPDTTFDPDRVDFTPAKLVNDVISVDSNTTEKIENLRLPSSEQESSTQSTFGTVTTNTTLSLVDFPPLLSLEKRP